MNATSYAKEINIKLLFYKIYYLVNQLNNSFIQSLIYNICEFNFDADLLLIIK